METRVTVAVAPGCPVTINFVDENGYPVDGQFEIHFNTKEHPGQLLIKETADLPGSDVGAAGAVLYREVYDPQLAKQDPSMKKGMKE